MLKKVILGVFLLNVSVYSQTSNAVDANSCQYYNESTEKCQYHRGFASQYATNHWDTRHETTWEAEDGTWIHFPFNCTNFVSQSILAGFVGKKHISREDLFSNRYAYAIDENQYRGNQWYYLDSNSRGKPWSEANSLHKYAKTNKDTYRGLHFDLVTRGQPSELNLLKIQTGDVIFLINSDSTDAYHAIIVSGYNFDKLRTEEDPKLYLKVASNTSYYNEELIHVMNRNPNDTYEVYRPTFYSDKGL